MSDTYSGTKSIAKVITGRQAGDTTELSVMANDTVEIISRGEDTHEDMWKVLNSGDNAKWVSTVYLQEVEIDNSAMAHYHRHDRGYDEEYENGLREGGRRGYDVGYRAGADAGHSEGRKHGHEDGLKRGHDVGLEQGLDQGRAKGFELGLSLGREDRAEAFERGRACGVAQGTAQAALHTF